MAIEIQQWNWKRESHRWVSVRRPDRSDPWHASLPPVAVALEVEGRDVVQQPIKHGGADAR